MQGACVDLGDRPQQLVQPRTDVALVGQEHAAVFSGECRPEAILEKARGANDQRMLADLVEHRAELLHHPARELRVLEHLEDHRVLVVNLVDALVLVTLQLGQAGVIQELLDDIGAQEKRLRTPDRN